MNFLYVTSIPTPFQIDFYYSLISKLNPKSSTLIFTNKISAERKHWNPKSDGITLKGVKLFSFITLLFNLKPDIVIFSKYNSPLILIVIFYSFFFKKKYLIGPSEVLQPTSNFRKLVKELLFGLVAYRSSGLLVVGNHSIKYYQKLFSGPIINSPYCFDLRPLLHKKSFEFTQDTLTFLISGRLEKFRNPILGIEIGAHFLEKNPKARLIISGQGSLKNECEMKIDELKIRDRVIWKNNFSSWKDIHNIYFEANILLALQNYSGWGIIIQEAMAAGMIIIASNKMAAANDLIIDGYNGFLVDIENHSEIKNKILKVINNIYYSKFLSQNARKDVEVVDIENISTRVSKFIKFINE